MDDRTMVTVEHRYCVTCGKPVGEMDAQEFLAMGRVCGACYEEAMGDAVCAWCGGPHNFHPSGPMPAGC